VFKCFTIHTIEKHLEVENNLVEENEKIIVDLNLSKEN